MFVSENSLFNQQQITLKIFNAEGEVMTISAAPDLSIENLKNMSLCHFYNPSDIIKLTSLYKLVLVTGNFVLDNFSTVFKENLKDNDVLLLLRKRMGSHRTSNHEDEVQHAPTDEEICSATANLTSANSNRVADSGVHLSHFHIALRQILITLIEVAVQILSCDQASQQVFHRLQEKLQRRISQSHGDKSALRQLLDMGFPEKKALKALRLKRSNPAEALEWLLEHASDPDMEVSEDEETPGSSASGSLPDSEQKSGRAVMECEQCGQQTANTQTGDLSQDQVMEIIHSFMKLNRQDFRPKPVLAKMFQEMGFSSSEIVDALWVAGNNEDAAFEWLFSGRKPSPDDMDKGLDKQSSLYQAIISNPIIQIGLTKPKMLLAFVSIVENQNHIQVWFNDPDSAPLLSQIFKIYHAEKHSITRSAATAEAT